MTAFVTRPSTVEGKGDAINLVVAAITNSTLDHSAIVVGFFELQDLRYRDHRLSFGTLGIWKFKPLSIAGPSRAVAEIEEEFGHTRTSGFRAGGHQ